MTRATPAATAPTAGPAPAPAPVRRRSGFHRPAACATLTLAALAAAVAPPAWTWTAPVLSVAVVGWGGTPLYRAAWAGLRRGALTADVLPAAGLLAVLAAAVWSTARGAAGPVSLVAAAAATTFLLAGRHAQERAERRAATLLEAVAPVPASPGTGDRFAVGPGERVDVDAVVVEGRSAVLADDAATPVEVAPGDRVTAGGRNAGNRLVLEVAQAPYRAAVEAGRGAVALRRAAERAAGGFTCLVVVLAVATSGFWAGAGTGVAAAVGAAGAVLLAACPRVAGSAAATAVLAATGRAMELGALPGGPRVLERAARVDTVVLCRTGTLTSGVRRLQSVHVAPGVDPDEALRLAGAVASAAQEAGGVVGGHPVGAVVAAEARARFGELPGVAEFDGYPGLGVRGVVTELCADPDGDARVIAHAALLGRTALLTAHGITLPPELAGAVERVHAAGSTAVAVSWDGVARAVLEVEDPLRSGSAAAVRSMCRLGITPVLLTGDDAGTGRGLAAALGIDPADVLAEVAPDGRAAAVAGLRARGRTVAVLGGPVDAESLAVADVALVRPGGPPLDGIALADDEPLTAVDALRLARRAVRTVERVVVATVAVHLVALPLAATGLLPPLVAAAVTAAWPAAAATSAAELRRLRPLERSAT